MRDKTETRSKQWPRQVETYWRPRTSEMIGIPYAQVEESGERICPVCGECCPERRGAEGELLSNAYGEHYLARHIRELDGVTWEEVPVVAGGRPAGR